ncbi:MAG: hypothetical protein JW860_07425, partial [Sedimentisphaerales bacterium]|nr:hypothetical protein [Sedimentisphaerales bacterium]
QKTHTRKNAQKVTALTPDKTEKNETNPIYKRAKTMIILIKSITYLKNQNGFVPSKTQGGYPPSYTFPIF